MAIMRPSVENLRSLGNFSQTFRWAIIFLTFPKLIAYEPTVDDLNFRAESTDIPEKAGMATEIQIRGNVVRQPGIYTWTSPVNLTLVETTNPVVNKFIWEWNELCWQSLNGSTGITQNQADLECDLEFIQLNNKDEPIFKHHMFGAFIENSTLGQLDSTTADPQKPQISLAYQRCERKPLK